MEPANSKLAENILPVDIADFELRRCGIAPVGNSECAPDAVAPLGEIETVTHGSAYSVIFHPFYQGGINSALKHKVLNKTADFIIGKGGNRRRFQTEASSQTSCNVVFSAALPDTEGT